MTSCTSLGCTPARSAAVAQPCCKSYTLTPSGRPAWRASCLNRRLNQSGLIGAAVLLGEHEIVVVLAPGPQAPLLDLGGPPGSQHRDGDRGQDDDLGDGGTSVVHLGSVSEHGPVFDLDELLVDRQHAGLEVDGRPGQAQDLAVVPKFLISRPCRNGTMRLGSARLSWSGGVSEGGLEPPRPMRALGPQPSASAYSATPTWCTWVRADCSKGPAGVQGQAGRLMAARSRVFQGVRVKPWRAGVGARTAAWRSVRRGVAGRSARVAASACW